MSPRCLSFCLAIFLVLPLCVMAQPPAVDESLTLEQYRELGIARPDRIWGASEYAGALARLSSISRAALPRFGSKHSGVLFGRMISTENILPAGGIRQVIDSGLQIMVANSRRLVAYSNTAPALMMLYYQRSPGVQQYSPEIVRLALFSLQICRPMFDLVGVLMKGASARKLASPEVVTARMDMRNALNSALYSLMETTEDEAHFRSADLEFLADGILKELPGLQGYLSVAQKAGLRSRIRSVSMKHSNTRVRESLAGILAVLKN